jgi:copper chaperone CopZ
MRLEYTIKTDCFACLGIIKEIIKKIDGVSDVKLDSAAGKIIIEYEGKFNKKELAGIIKEKTGYELQ